MATAAGEWIMQLISKFRCKLRLSRFAVPTDAHCPSTSTTLEYPIRHPKVVLVDGQWASVGTANLDNRSLRLNFEIDCMIHSPAAVAILEQGFLHDLTRSIRLDQGVYNERPFASRLLENACRLMSPVL